MPSKLSTALITQQVGLEPANSLRLASLCGPFNEHIAQLEKSLDVTIKNRGNLFSISGEKEAVSKATYTLEKLYALTADDPLTAKNVHLFLQEDHMEPTENEATLADSDVVIETRKKTIKARGVNQRSFVKSMLKHPVTMGIGPAGTGKTYLAVACAVQALEREEVARIILTRPAVEAGERLGFLPGDLIEKVNPYLRPLYDALFEMLGVERVEKLMERNIIEIAPLAFMRGRTLNDAFIILDEAQNTTEEQIKMFLTRLGFGSTMVVTGDETQVDLPRHTRSGLKLIRKVLKDVEGVEFVDLDERDVVRHPVVQRIVGAYSRYDKAQETDES